MVYDTICPASKRRRVGIAEYYNIQYALTPVLEVSRVSTNSFMATFTKPVRWTKDPICDNGDVTVLTISPSLYRITVTGSDPGDITVTIPRGSVKDSKGRLNSRATTSTTLFDLLAPLIELVTPSITNQGYCEINIHFPANVVRFGASYISTTTGAIIATGTVEPIDGSRSAFHTTAIFEEDGTFAIEIQDSVVEYDLLDVHGINVVCHNSNTVVVTYDSTAPIITLSDVQTPINTSFEVDILFDESVTSPLTLGDISTTNATLSDLGPYLGSDNKRWGVLVHPTTSGLVSVWIPAGKFTDAAGNPNTISNVLSVTYDITRPTCVLTTSATSTPSTRTITVTMTSTEFMFDLDYDQFVLSRCELISSTYDSGSSAYIIVLRALEVYGATPAQFHVPEGAFTDAAGNINTVSNSVSFTYTPLPNAATLSIPSSNVWSGPAVVTLNFARPVLSTPSMELFTYNLAYTASIAAVGSSMQQFAITLDGPRESTATTIILAAHAAVDAELVWNAASNTVSLTLQYDPSADADVLAWYDPSDATTLFTDTAGTVAAAIGDTAACMKDKKNLVSGHHVTQSLTAKRPIVDGSTLNSKRSLRFINAFHTHLMDAGTTFWNRPNNSFAMVIRQNPSVEYVTGANPIGFMIGAKGGGGIQMGYTTGGFNTVFIYPNAGVYKPICAKSVLYNGLAHALTVSIDTTSTPKTVIGNCDGTSGSSLSGSPVQPSGGVVIGAVDTIAARSFDGWIGEVICYTVAKSTHEIQVIERYLKAKWSTP